MDAGQERLRDFFARLLRDHALVPWDVDADGNCLLYALINGMIGLARDGLWEWVNIGGHEEVRADLMNELSFNRNIYAHLDQGLDFDSHTARHRDNGEHLGSLEIEAFVRVTGIPVLV